MAYQPTAIEYISNLLIKSATTPEITKDATKNKIKDRCWSVYFHSLWSLKDLVSTRSKVQQRYHYWLS